MAIVEKKSLNHILKYDNKFVLSSNFNQLSSVQQDIFFSAVSYLCREKKDHVIIPAGSIKKRAGLIGKGYTDDQYMKLLHGLEDVLLHTIYTVHDDGKEWKGVLFSVFAIDEKTKDFEIFLNPQAAHYFYQIPGAFSRFELEAFLSLNSKFAKILFRMFLSAYQGVWNPSAEELIDIFGFKNKQAFANFLHRLDKYISEVEKTKYFHGQIEYSVNKNESKRGRPVQSVTFKFKKSEAKNDELSDLSRKWSLIPLNDEELSHARQGNIIIAPTKTQDRNKLPDCPHCGLPFVEAYSPKFQKFFYGHFDYEFSECKYAKKTFSSIEELNDFVAAIEKEECEKKEYAKKLEGNPIKELADRAAAAQKKYQATAASTGILEKPDTSEEIIIPDFTKLGHSKEK